MGDFKKRKNYKDFNKYIYIKKEKYFVWMKNEIKNDKLFIGFIINK